jgi:hypothetical protein
VSARKPVIVRTVGRQSVGFDGPHVFTGILELKIPYQRARQGDGWLVPHRHADDLAAWLSHTGARLEYLL